MTLVMVDGAGVKKRRILMSSGDIQITKEMAQEFYRDLCGTVYGDFTKNSQGIMSIGLIADHMAIPYLKAYAFCNAMIKYGITERQNGLVVV